MRTTKPISTIHYCEIKDLKPLLDDLINRNIITFYSFVKHIKESDETKDHIHLFIIPNGQINTDELRQNLIVPTLDLTKPIRPLPFECSKFSDWYLYCTHDTRYLISKGQSRSYHYQKEEFINSSDDALTEYIHKIDLSKINGFSMLLDSVNNGIPFEDMIINGQIPIQQLQNYEKAYKILTYSQLNKPIRNKASHHDSIEVNNNGEVIDINELPF